MTLGEPWHMSTRWSPSRIRRCPGSAPSHALFSVEVLANVYS